MEHEYAQVLDQHLQSIESLPVELADLLHQIRDKSSVQQEIKEKMKQNDSALKHSIKSGLIQDDLTEDQKVYYDEIQSGFNEALLLSDDQINTSERALMIVDKHVKRLQTEIGRLRENEGLPVQQTVPMVDYNFLSQLSTPFNDKNAVKKERKITTNRKLMKRKTIGDEGYGLQIDDTLYCFCQQASYGEMIACENGEECLVEWFHLECVGLTEPPTGKWFCPECKQKKRQRTDSQS